MNEGDFNYSFLDVQMNERVNNLRKKHKSEYEIINEFNLFFYKLLDKVIKKGKTEQNLYILVSIVEMHKFYQSSIILFERGLYEAGNSLIRTMVDILIKIVEVIRHEDSVEKLKVNEYYEVQNMLNYIYVNKLYSFDSEKDLSEILEKVKEKTKSKENPRIKTKDLAENNKMKDAYMIFKYKSEYTHLSTSVMEKIIQEDDEGHCYIKEEIVLDNFREDIAFSISIVCSMIEYILREYIKDADIETIYKKLSAKYESEFKDIINFKPNEI